MLEITTRERDQSSDEEICRAYAEALQSPKAAESPKHSHHTSDLGTEDCHNDEPSLGSLGLFTGPKYFIKIKFFPSEYKAYELDCMIDSGCQMNLEKGNAIPLFYWEKANEHGVAMKELLYISKEEFHIFQ